ncbi:MAG: hypothetical protein J2P37_36210, partial [Ktedonobacteraceae bacterium]|nr:hypothetical protein [Ktedonobacteraceae bacterium]
WLVTIGVGIVFVLTPAMLSHDIFSYAGYGRLQVLYHANPYFTSLAIFPHDSFRAINDWPGVPSAYGPIWQMISGVLVPVIGDSPSRAILAYRSLALMGHLLNVVLIMCILQALGRSSRTVASGMLLYAWNPLVLEESVMGGHNDVLMMTLILLGLLFSVRNVERGRRLPLRAYLPTLAALSAAALVKFSALPVLWLYFVLLARQAYGGRDGVTVQSPGSRMKAVMLTIVPGGIFCGAVILLFYLPYWIGFTIPQIIASFSLLPSSRLSYNSIMSSVVYWEQRNQLPGGNWLSPILAIFSEHQTWSIISAAVLIGGLGVGAIWIWNSPSTRTVALAGLAATGTMLAITPWFYPWYLIWIVGLAAIVLPAGRFERALQAAVLVFSASALCTYLYINIDSSIGGWKEESFLFVLVPPLLTLLGFWAWPERRRDGESVGDIRNHRRRYGL